MKNRTNNIYDFKMAFKENKRAFITSLVGLLISSIIIILIFNVSYYFAIIFIPVSILEAITLNFLLKQLLRNGLYYSKYKSTTFKFSVKHGQEIEYYDSGIIKSTIDYEWGLKNGIYILFDPYKNILQKKKYKNGEFCNENIEYYNDGKIRMIQNDYKYSCFDNNSILRCEFYICTEEISWDDYRENIKNTWYKWQWNINKRFIFKPFGIWKEYNNNGKLTYDLNFNNYNVNSYQAYNVLKTIYDLNGNILSTELINPKKIIIEFFDEVFAFERLINNKAYYQTVHHSKVYDENLEVDWEQTNKYSGWQYEEFEIYPVICLENILEIYKI